MNDIEMLMTQMPCGYAGDRDETLIAYLYDDIDPAARAEFDAHLATCDLCRAELEALGGVRSTLARWNPPEPGRVLAFESQAGTRGGRTRWGALREIPAWAQVAAALLVLGVSAGMANLDVRYDSNGLAIRTGWSKPAAPQSVPTSAAVTTQIGNASQSGGPQPFAPASKADLAALERQFRAGFRPQSTMAVPVGPVGRPASSEAEILRKVRALIDEAERRQQRELALRLAQAITDINAQRQADLRRVDVTLNRVENNLGVEVLKNRQSMQQYLMRVNQRQ